MFLPLKRIEPGVYRGQPGGNNVMIDRADSGAWFWMVQLKSGGTKGGHQFTLNGAKRAAFFAIVPDKIGAQ